MRQGQDELLVRDVETRRADLDLAIALQVPRAPVTTLDMIQEENTYHT